MHAPRCWWGEEGGGSARRERSPPSPTPPSLPLHTAGGGTPHTHRPAFPGLYPLPLARIPYLFSLRPAFARARIPSLGGCAARARGGPPYYSNRGGPIIDPPPIIRTYCGARARGGTPYYSNRGGPIIGPPPIIRTYCGARARGGTPIAGLELEGVPLLLGSS